MIKVNNKRYKELKQKEQVIETIIEVESSRENLNFALAHIVMGIALVITFTTRLF